MNDAAEALRMLFGVSKVFEAFPLSPAEAEAKLDAALAEERKLTVERIREAVGLTAGWEGRVEPPVSNPFDLDAILKQAEA